MACMRHALVRLAATVTVAAALAAGTNTSVPRLEARTAEPSIAVTRLELAVSDDWAERSVPHLAPIAPGLSEEELRIVVGAVEDGARRFDLNPEVVLAVIEVESRFDPRAVSSAGAMGLMQLRPETAREQAEELGLQWTSDELLFDPEVNVLLGSFYLKRLMVRFEDVDAALAAFNAGPSRIAARHRRTGTVPLAYADRVWDALVDLRAATSAGGSPSRPIS